MLHHGTRLFYHLPWLSHTTWGNLLLLKIYLWNETQYPLPKNKAQANVLVNLLQCLRRTFTMQNKIVFAATLPQTHLHISLMWKKGLRQFYRKPNLHDKSWQWLYHKHDKLAANSPQTFIMQIKFAVNLLQPHLHIIKFGRKKFAANFCCKLEWPRSGILLANFICANGKYTVTLKSLVLVDMKFCGFWNNRLFWVMGNNFHLIVYPLFWQKTCFSEKCHLVHIEALESQKIYIWVILIITHI